MEKLQTEHETATKELRVANHRLTSLKDQLATEMNKHSHVFFFKDFFSRIQLDLYCFFIHFSSVLFFLRI